MERELFTSSVERDVEKLLRASNIQVPKYFSILDIEVPKTQLAQDATAFAKKELDEIMFNHSQRVYLLGHVVSQTQFPDWGIHNYEDYYLTSILHDIGVAPKYHLTTSMSFELKGALLSHNFITEHQGSQATADVVAEAINRHTDFVPGKIQPVGQLIQLATTLDVIGANPDLYNNETIDEIVHQWPRKNFNNHFADLMELEMKYKPGSHTTSLVCSHFVPKIRDNKVMAKYDN